MTLAPYSPALRESPAVSATVRNQIRDDYHRFAQRGLPADLESELLSRHGLDVRSTYAGFEIKNPWGKASGQLSMTAHQVADDVEAGLGFVVLKTVIAQDETGRQTMGAWAVPESKMVVERLTGQAGESGWTVSWKGRGWWWSFDDYLDLIRQAQQSAAGRGTLIVPSCKFHLPTPAEPEWNVAEYNNTLPQILAAWQQGNLAPMPLEKDFSPTLAGSDRATEQSQILSWLRRVPAFIRAAVPENASPVRVGLKLFNALFDDEFQLETLRAIHQPGPDQPDFFIHANRLFDPDRVFEGHRGIAYGGPDLSDRNLRVMAAFQEELSASPASLKRLEWSATGNVTTGRMALEYALCGASSFQLHTFFQLPLDQYKMTMGHRTSRALCELYFHPETGFVIWMLDLAKRLSLPAGLVRFQDVIGRRREL